MKKLFKCLAVILLSVFMIAGNMSIPVHAIKDEGSGDLNSMLENFTVRDSSGNQTTTVKPGTTYKVNMSFKESGTDFSTDEMSYVIPDGVHLTLDNDPSYFDMTVTDYRNGGKTISIPNNTYTIQDGKVVVHWNPDFIDQLRGTINASFSIQTKATFDRKDNGYDIKGDGSTIINVDSNHDVTVSKWGEYDKNQKKMHYVVTATSTGTNDNVKVTDTVTGSLLSLNSGSWNMTITRNNQTATGLSASVTDNGKGFTSTIGHMGDGEVIKYDYYADVNFNGLGTGMNLTKEQTGNQVKVEKNERPDTNAEFYSNQIDYSTISKQAGAVSEADTTGKRTVPWTIIVNPEATRNMAESNLSDAIATASQPYMKYSGNGITIQKLNAAGNPDGNPVTVAWNSTNLNKTDAGWNYTFPADAGTSGYKVTYTTEVDASQLKVTTRMDNTTTTTSTGRTATGSVNVKPSETELTLSKSAVDVNWESVRWRYSITVPKSGTSKAVVTDTLPSIWYNNNVLWDTLKSSDIQVTGKTNNESYSIRFLDGNGNSVTNPTEAVKFEITFTHNNGVPGFAPSNQERTITVNYESKNNETWLDSVQNHGNTQVTHTNSVELDYGQKLSTTANAVPALTSLNKSLTNLAGGGFQGIVKHDGKDVKVPAWKFAITLKGVHSDEIKITDNYDSQLKGLVKIAKLSDLDGYYWNDGDKRTPAFLSYGDSEPAGDWPSTTDYIDAKPGQTDSLITEKNDGSGFEFNYTLRGKAKKGADGYFGYYKLYYVLMPKDYASYQKIRELAAKSDKSELKLENTATWGNMNDKAEFSYTYPRVEKQIKYYTSKNDGTPSENTTDYNNNVLTARNNKVKFILNVNPDADNIVVGKDTYQLTDTFTSGNISPDVESIKITRKDGTDITDQYSYDLKQDGTGIVFTLPDKTALTITYDAFITSNGTGAYANKIVNTAEIEGYTTSTDGVSRIDWSASGTAEAYSATIRKNVYGNLGKTVSGAQYTLYDGDGSQGVNGTKISGPFTTNDKGIAVITGPNNSSLFDEHQYYLMETYAPEGYQLDPMPHVFQLVKNADKNLPDQVMIGTQILLNDKIENFRIKKVNKNGKALKGAEFTLSGGDLKEKQIVTTDDDGIASFSGLSANQEYKLEEFKAPEGYDKSGPWTIKLDENLVPSEKNNKFKFDSSKTGNITTYSANITDEKSRIEISGKKVWKDEGVNRPAYVSLELQDKESGGFKPVYDKNGKPVTKKVTAPDWTYTFEGLDPDKTYRVVEIGGDKNYQSTIGTKENNWQVINTRTGTIAIPVEKKWVNGSSIAHVFLERHQKNSDNWIRINQTIFDDKTSKYTFENLPEYDSEGKEYEYRVTEEKLDGYMDPIIEGDEKSGFVIKNIKLETNATIGAYKVLTGKSLAAGEFNFNLIQTESDYSTVVKDGVQDTATNDVDGSVHFNQITYTVPDQDYYYVISEQNNNVKNIVYDAKEYHVHVHTFYDSEAEKLKSSVEYQTKISTTNGDAWVPVDKSNVKFNNTYTPEKTSTELKAEKIVSGRDDVNESFIFRLESLEGAPMPDGVAGIQKDVSVKTGQVSFGNISYANAGVYRYRIYEVDPDPSEKVKNGYQYDNSVYEAIVTVKDEGGKLTASKVYKNISNTTDEKKAETVAIPTFTNQFSWESVPAKIRVTKGFTENAKNALNRNHPQSFTFTLTSENKTVETQTINTDDGSEQTISFDQLKFDHPGVYTATVFENDLSKEQSDAGWIKDGHGYTITFNVVENKVNDIENGTLSISSATVNGQTLTPDQDGYYQIPGKDQPQTFVNDFNENKTVEYLHISKFVYGYPSDKQNEDTFDFRILALKKNGSGYDKIDTSGLVPSGDDVSENADGSYTVSGINANASWTSSQLSFTEPGDYRYVITEIAGNKKYYQYSDDTYTVDIHVKRDDNNHLTHTTEYTRDPGKQSEGDGYRQKDGQIDVAQFINEYRIPSSVTIYPGVWKNMVNDEALKAAQNDPNAKFSFTLTGSDDNPGSEYDSSFQMKAVIDSKDLSSDSGKNYVRFRKVNKNGKITEQEGMTFDKSFSSHDIYTFRVTEDDTDYPYKKDNSVYLAKFDLQDNGDGTLSIKRMRITRDGEDVYYADNNDDDWSKIVTSDYADIAIPNANAVLNDHKVDHIRQNMDNTYEADVRFTNDYTPEKGTAEISVTKILTGYPEEGKNSMAFNFELKGTDRNKKHGSKYDDTFADHETVIVGNVNGKNRKTDTVKFMADPVAGSNRFIFDKAGLYEFTIDELYENDPNAELKPFYTRYRGIKKDSESTEIHVYIEVTEAADNKLSTNVYYTRDQNLIDYLKDKDEMPGTLTGLVHGFKCLTPYKEEYGTDKQNDTVSFHNVYKPDAADGDFTVHKGFVINGSSISTNSGAAGKEFKFKVTLMQDAADKTLNYDKVCSKDKGCTYNSSEKSLTLTDHILSQKDIDELKKTYPGGNHGWSLDASKEGFRELQPGDEQLDGQLKDKLPKRNSTTDETGNKVPGKFTQGVRLKTPKFTKPGNYVYRIDEIDSGYEDFKTDPVFYYVTYVVTDNGTGKLTAKEQHTASLDLTGTATSTSIRFHNEYVPESTVAKIKVKKTIADAQGNIFPESEFSDETRKKMPFTFTLSGTADNEALYVSDPAYGTGWTGKSVTLYGNTEGEIDIPITQVPTINSPVDGEGNHYHHYKFNLQEDIPAQLNSGFTAYDSRKYTAEFDVKDQNGKLVVENYQYKTDSSVSDKEAEFVNTYQYAPVSLNLEVTKSVSNLDDAHWPSDGFTFNLTASNDNPDGAVLPEITTATATSNAKTAVFSPITFTKIGRYLFTIKETIPSDADENHVKNGITYSDAEHTAVVDVTSGKDGKLITKVTYDGKEDVPVVTNTYGAAGTWKPTALKTVDGEKPKTSFGFELSAVNDEAKVKLPKAETASNDMDGNIIFDPIGFTQDDVGKKFVFRMKETSKDENGMIADTTVHKIKVTVTDNGNGLLKVTPVYDDGKTTEITFDNHAVGSLEVTKKVESVLKSDKKQEFSFHVQLSDQNINGQYGGMNFRGGSADVKLYDGGSVKADNLPSGITYVVTEDTPEGFSVTGTGETGTITRGTVAEAVITNTRNTGKLTFTKQFSGVTEEALKNISFTVTGPEGFKEKTYKLSDLKNDDGTYSKTLNITVFGDYKVTEKNAGIPGYHVDVTYTAGDQTSTEIPSVRIDNGTDVQIQINDTYSQKPVETSLHVTKSVKNLKPENWPAEGFKFRLSENGEHQDGVELPDNVTATATSEKPTAAFHAIRFRKAGTYKFNIQEVIPDDAVKNQSGEYVRNGITYSETHHTAEVNVTDDQKGNLIAKVTYDGRKDVPVVTNTYGAEGTWKPTALKTVDGEKPKTSFGFELSAVNDEAEVKLPKAETASNDMDGNIIFDPIGFTQDDVGKKFVFRMKETSKDGNGYMTDQKVHEIEVTVKDNGDGTLNVVPEYKGEKSVVFNNHAVGSLSLTKKVTGSGDKNRDFHFTVKLDNDQIDGKYGDLTFRDGVAETTLKDGQTVKADKLPAGVHYEVIEKEANQDGYATDSQNASGEVKEGQNIAVLFTNDKPEKEHPVPHDNVKPSPTPKPSTPVPEHKKPETKKDVTPDTSDHTNIGGWTSLMIAGMAIAVITFITRRKYSR